MTSRDPTQPKTPRMGVDGTPFEFDKGRTKPGAGHYGRLDAHAKALERTMLDLEPMRWPLDHMMVRGEGPGCRPTPPHLQSVFRDVFGADRVDSGRLVLCFHPLLKRWVIAQRRYLRVGDSDQQFYETIWICSTFQTEDLPEEYVPTDWREDADIHRYVFAASGMHEQVGEYREPDRSDFEDVLCWGSTLQARREGTDLEQKHADREVAEQASWQSTAESMDHDLVTHQDRNIFAWMNDGIITRMNVQDVRRAEYKSEWDIRQEYAGRDPLKVKLIQHDGWKEFVPRSPEEASELQTLIMKAQAGAKRRADDRSAMRRPATRRPSEIAEEIIERDLEPGDDATVELPIDRLRRHAARVRNLN